MLVNVIGAETYVKNCSPIDRWSVAVSLEQAEKIASGVKEGYINIRHVQGTLVPYEGEEVLLIDNFGRIAEALSLARIQLQQSEVTVRQDGSFVNVGEGRSWAITPTQEAKGWKEIFVDYVYMGETPSERLQSQASNNPDRILYQAGEIYIGQYAGLTDDLRLVIGDHLEEVVLFIQGDRERVKKVSTN